MSETIKTDICIIGAGSAGLTVAAVAAQLGADVTLIERDRMGGDCLNTGCVPSKALLAAAKSAQNIREAEKFGIRAQEPKVDFAGVIQHVQDVIASIAPHDSVERFEGLGVRVIKEEARFIDEATLIAGPHRIVARRFVIATGSRPALPPIEGLEGTAYLTNETLFDLKDQPKHLAIIGGGPIGIEMAQAFRRLGSKVTLFEMATILPKDDPEAVAIIRDRLVAEGIEIIEGAEIKRVETGRKTVKLHHAGGELETSHLLVAAGRKPNLERLDLGKAAVAHSPKGIETGKGIQTSNKRILAIGDVTGGPQFTHAAGYLGGLAIKSLLFRLPAKPDFKALPWVTYTEPELAQVGMTEEQAAKRGEIQILRWSFHDNDRAKAERKTDGFVKAVLDKKGRILGCTIIGPEAGELIHIWAFAISRGMKIGALSSPGWILPYPTLGEATKRTAGSQFTPDSRVVKLMRWIVPKLAKLG